MGKSEDNGGRAESSVGARLTFQNPCIYLKGNPDGVS